jgi:hypothetical protein
MSSTRELKYDVFISYASEDKESIVFPLASLLRAFGVRVWYDRLELKIGDSLSRSIDNGLSQSRYGIVIISPHFLNKDWPEYELKGLVSREIHSEKVILPIWHRVTIEAVLSYSPTLADKYSLDTSKFSITALTIKLIEVIRHDIYKNILRKIIRANYLAKLPRENIPIEDIRFGEPRHETLPDTLLVRIRISHKIFADVLDISLEDTIYNFRCDTTPEEEIEIWERMGAAYLEATYNKAMSLETKKAILSVLLDRSQGILKKHEYGNFAPLSDEEVEQIIQLYET